MADFSTYKKLRNSSYYVRILSAIIVAQLIVLAVIKLWPVPNNLKKPMREKDFSEDVVTLQEAIITRQPGSPPPPPKPSAPIPEPTDEPIEEEITEIAEVEFSPDTDRLSTSNIAGAGDAEGEIAGNPQQRPQIVRIVEATTPDAAQRAGIKAEITVRLLVAKDGTVEKASIDEIRRYTDSDSNDYKIVENIDYGLIKATLEAARQWTFRPAKKNGKPVRAYTQQVFTFGF